MNTKKSAITLSSLPERFHMANFGSEESEEQKLNQSLLILATGLISLAIMVWAAIYSLLNLKFSVDVPAFFFLLLVGNMGVYFFTRRFDFFRITQLGLFLFLPFVAQWAAGNVIVSSGVVLWGLLAPIGAMLCIGASESIGWFIAWIVLTALSGGVDYYLADNSMFRHSNIQVSTILLFFTLNFISVAAISYALLLFSLGQKRKLQKKLEEARKQLKVADEAAIGILQGPTIYI